MEYLLAYHTDKGKRKGVNQDSLLLACALYGGQQVILAVVCDGMGGFENGELASAEVVCAFSKWFRDDFQALAEKEEFEDSLYDSWEVLLKEEHRKLYAYGQKKGLRLGTTVTAMLLVQNEYYIAHVGDSRIYEIKEEVTQITRDQVLAGLTAGSGQRRPKAGGRSKSVLLQGLGASKEVMPVYFNGRVEADAVYLLCSDGFRHKVTSQELLQAFRPETMLSEDEMKRQAEQIAQTVMDREERDNLSALLIRTLPGQEPSEGEYRQGEFVIEREMIKTEMSQEFLL